MARYIDAELLDPEEFENCTQYQAREIIESIPTADVVPKIEVAIEIFDDIEKTLPNDLPLMSTIIIPYLKKFRDKYIKESHDERKDYVRTI